MLLRILSMCANDIDNVKKIDQQSFVYWPHQYYLKSLYSKNYFAFLAQFDRQFMGNIMFRLVKKNIYIDKIVVKKEYRHQGIGGKLLEKAIGSGKRMKATKVLLTVSNTNIYAIDLYSKHGFEIESIHWFHYFDLEHGVKMYRNI